jgi:hypothetical protein
VILQVSVQALVAAVQLGRERDEDHIKVEWCEVEFAHQPS